MGCGTEIAICHTSDRDSGDSLLDALERDHAVVVWRRRVRRLCDDDEAPIPVSRGRFQALQ